MLLNWILKIRMCEIQLDKKFISTALGDSVGNRQATEIKVSEISVRRSETLINLSRHDTRAVTDFLIGHFKVLKRLTMLGVAHFDEMKFRKPYHYKHSAQSLNISSSLPKVPSLGNLEIVIYVY